MTHHGIVLVCLTHRAVSHYGGCPVCGNYDFSIHPKWRAPKKNNDAAWKLLEKGDYLWDKRAVIRKKEKKRERRLDFGRADRLRWAQWVAKVRVANGWVSK